MKIILRIILPFALLLGFFTTCKSSASSISGNTESEAITIDTTDNTVLHINPFLDFGKTDFIATENIIEDESLSVAPLKSNILLIANFCNCDFSETVKTKVNNKHFLLGNMIPVRNIPRYILFHSLQIHF